MSSTTIEVQPDDKSKASGYGMALVGVAIEQDAAYWEAHVEVVAEQSTTAQSEIMLGVATKKDRQFFNELQEQKGKDIQRNTRIWHAMTLGSLTDDFFPASLRFVLQTEAHRWGRTTCGKSKSPTATWWGFPCSSRICPCFSSY
jgi:hypothetical protein